MTVDVSPTDIAGRLAEIQARIDAACEAAQRPAGSVRLLPVTKTVSEPLIRAAHAAGCRWFGENKVQEAQAKAEAMADLAADWCVIGHLQTNKARHVVQFAAELHSLDSVRLAEELDRRLQSAGRSLRVLIQVNTSGEASKSGLAPEEVPDFLQAISACQSLAVAGFMTLALPSEDDALVRACFQSLAQVRERARQDGPAHWRYDELSMGMSGDFELAIAEGATIVRLGTSIFGARD
ncbi:YggS family pyridoxal phosphate-dependent enzyme [Achromobacter sp. GG226]|nr:YggS family pyridoxal phosphate-dependent enzyme [Verticiella sp. GG226]